MPLARTIQYATNWFINTILFLGLTFFIVYAGVAHYLSKALAPWLAIMAVIAMVFHYMG